MYLLSARLYGSRQIKVVFKSPKDIAKLNGIPQIFSPRFHRSDTVQKE